MAVEAPPVGQKIELFGFQEGDEGFVRYGIRPPIDYCFLRVRAGRGAGKSMGGALRMMFYMVEFPGSAGMVLAPVAHMLDAATFPSIRKAFEMAGLREQRDWDYNVTRQAFHLRNGSMAYFRTTENPARIPGPDLAWAWFDEDRLAPESAFIAVLGALRQPGYPHQLWLSSTSGGKRHWSRKIFKPEEYAQEFDELVCERTVGVYKDYQALTRDNPHGGAELHKVLAQTLGEGTALARQELLGEELILENLVFPTWDAQKQMVPREQWPVQQPKHVVAGMDFGYSNPSAIVVLGVGGSDHYVMAEFKRSRLDEETLCGVAKRLVEEHQVEFLFCDSADPRYIMALRRAGLPAYPAKKTLGVTADPSSGLGLCNGALNRGFYVDPKCMQFRQEIEDYCWLEPRSDKNASEIPRQHNDHLMAAWRYAEIGAKQLWGFRHAGARSLAFTVG